MQIKDQPGIEIFAHANLGLQPIGVQKANVVESVIGPNSELIGKSIRQINLHEKNGILILAMHRQGEKLREDLEGVKLKFGDTILMEGAEKAINRLREDRNFLLLSDVPHLTLRRHKMWIAISALLLVVVLASFKIFPISSLALMAAVVVVLTGCLEMDEAYRSVNWKIMFLIFGMLSLGMALQKTGGSELIASRIFLELGWLGPLGVLAMIYLITWLLTEILSNSAVAVLVTPIAITMAHTLQVDPRPFVMAVAIAASTSFSTPIGYQTNTLVYGAGGYKFTDFMKVGIPLNIIFWILSVYFIPKFWPF